MILAGALDLLRTNLIYYTIVIGNNGFVRKGIRRNSQKIKIVKLEIDKLKSARMFKLMT